MSEQILKLFPDTNLFIQCKSLEEITWSDLGNYSEIHLIISRPVQREIDNQKSKPGRVGDRARKANKLFRKMLESHDPQIQNNAVVKVHFSPDSSYLRFPDKGLDLDKPDDQLVACAHVYKLENPESPTKILTHDVGVMATCKSLSVDYHVIPNSWLLAPETSEENKKIKHLEDEILKLKKLEPQLELTLLDDDNQIVDQICREYCVYRPLEDHEVEALIDRLQRKFPMQREFGMKVPDENSNLSSLMAGMGLTPPPKEEIDEYQKNRYPAWIEECREYLYSIHSKLNAKNGFPTFQINLANSGTRPGKDVLIEFESFGDFLIKPVRDADDSNSDDNEEYRLKLPDPPSPPKMTTLADVVNSNLGTLNLGLHNFHDLGFNPSALIGQSVQTDQNAFYLSDGSFNSFFKRISYTCEQFRHGTDVEEFLGKIVFNYENQGMSGMLQCIAHAENISKPVTKKFPIRIKTVEKDTLEAIEKLI